MKVTNDISEDNMTLQKEEISKTNNDKIKNPKRKTLKKLEMKEKTVQKIEEEAYQIEYI